MIKNNLKLLAALAILQAGQVFAAGAPVSHQFQGGQPASASQVNENFQELADRIANIPDATSIDYHAYLSTVSSKTFVISGSTSNCTTEIHNYARTQTGDTTNITVTVTSSNSGTPCSAQFRHYTAGPNQYKSTSIDDLDSTTMAVLSTTEFRPARIMLVNPMMPGHQYSFNSETYRTPQIGPNAGIEENTSHEIRDIAAIGIEDITVAAGSFTGCLKIRKDAYYGLNSTRILRWRCPTVGDVKTISISTSVDYQTSSYVIRELTSYTP